MSRINKPSLLSILLILYSFNHVIAQFGTPFNANTTFTPSFAPVMTVSEVDSETVFSLLYYTRLSTPPDDSQVYYLRSNLSGAENSWTDPLPLSVNVPSPTINDIAVDVSLDANLSVVMAVWQQQNKIFGSRSIDKGVTFEAAFEISSGAADFRQLPDVKIDNNNRIHIVWAERTINPGPITVKYTTSVFGEEGTWDGAVDALSTSISVRPKLIIDNTNDWVIVAAHEISGGQHTIQSRRKSRNPLALWDNAAVSVEVVTLNGTSDTYLNLAIDNNNDVYLIYMDNIADDPNVIPPSNNVCLVSSSSPNQGISWTAPVCIGAGFLPDITVVHDTGTGSPLGLHAVWHEPIDSTTGNIKFRGGSFPDVITDDTAWSPAITINSATELAGEISGAPSWSSVDSIFGQPGILSHAGRSTVFWVENDPIDNGEEKVALAHEIVPCVDVESFSMNITTSPFANATFPIEITAVNSLGLAIDDPSCDVGEITITSDLGTFSPTKNPVNVTSSPFTFFGFLDIPGSVTLTATLDADPSITGTSNSFTVRDTLSAGPDLQFIESQRDPGTGMVITVFNQAAPDNTAHIYTNALAIIAFIYKGVLAGDSDPSFTAYASQILTNLRDNAMQITTGENSGGFFDAYDATTLAAVTTNITSGNNAWLLMAINYYTIYTNDNQFLNMAVDIGKFLQERQVIVSDPDPDINPMAIGGVYSRDTEKLTYVTEHQAEAFSGFLYLSQIDGVSTADALSFGNSASEVKRFMIGPRNAGESDPLFNSAQGRFEVALNRTTNTSLDAQTASFLAFPGPLVNDGTNDIDISPSLDFVFTNIFKSQNYQNLGRSIDGPTFREDDPDANCHGLTNIDSTIIDATQMVWIEGAGQLALALQELIDSPQGTAADSTNRTNLLTNIQKVRDESASYPTHLGEQFECADLDADMLEDEALSVGTEELSVAPAAWAYFNKLNPKLNPYTPEPVLIVDQDKIFIPGDGMATVSYTVTLRQAKSVDNRDIEFIFESGNGSLDGNPSPTTFTRSTSTGTNGMVTLNYTAGSMEDISKITINLRESQSK